MQYGIGDKVVHPRYGPGRIAGIQQWEPGGEANCYYVIEIPQQGLTVRVPVLKADEVGMRPAMPPSRLPQLLGTLQSTPRRLPDDHKMRQEQIGAEFRTGQVLDLAMVVRDLTWHGQHARLTKSDVDYLRLGQDLLAAEMSLVSGEGLTESSQRIGSAIAAALAGKAA